MLGFVYPTVVDPFAYRCDIYIGALASPAITLGQGIHTVGADGQGLWHADSIGHLHHSPSTEFHGPSGIALPS